MDNKGLDNFFNKMEQIGLERAQEILDFKKNQANEIFEKSRNDIEDVILRDVNSEPIKKHIESEFVCEDFNKNGKIGFTVKVVAPTKVEQQIFHAHSIGTMVSINEEIYDYFKDPTKKETEEEKEKNMDEKYFNPSGWEVQLRNSILGKIKKG